MSNGVILMIDVAEIAFEKLLSHGEIRFTRQSDKVNSAPNLTGKFEPFAGMSLSATIGLKTRG